MKINSKLTRNFWFLYILPLFIIVSFTDGLYVSLILSGLMISGFSIGIIIPVIIGVIIGKFELKTIYTDVILFIISTTLLYINIQDKNLLAYIVPFSFPMIIIGIIALRK